MKPLPTRCGSLEAVDNISRKNVRRL